MREVKTITARLFTREKRKTQQTLTQSQPLLAMVIYINGSKTECARVAERETHRWARRIKEAIWIRKT